MLPDPVYEDAGLRLFHGSNLEVLRADALGYPHEFGYHPDRLIPDGTYDSICTDPPYELGFMGKGWDSSGIAYDVDLWRECLRVLKPGGHLLAFGGKSMNVAKAIAATEAGHGSNSGAIRRATMGDAYVPSGRLGNRDGAGRRETGLNDHDLALGETAQEWEGWGTALKPAFEPVVVARKPLGGRIDVRARVEHELRARGVVGDISWIRSSASDAASTSRTASSGSTAAPRMAATSARHASASVTPRTVSETEKCTASRGEGGEKLTPSTHAQRVNDVSENCAPQSSRPTEGNAPAAASSKTSSSRSTTSTVEAQHTEDPCTARSTHRSVDSDTQADTESFAGTATGLIGSQAHVLIRRNPDGAFLWPTDLPESVSVGSTVAANVLAHGTGALNIEATRTATSESLNGGAYAKTGGRAVSGSLNPSGMNVAGATAHGEFEQPSGRWPTNVLLDGSQADALDVQTGVLSSGMMRAGTRAQSSGGDIYGKRGEFVTSGATYGDSGGASRFFPTFRYEAKAPTSERPNVEGTVHATVKPLALIRWLVRLVTRPGGRVLDPFAGSGTTGEAALLEGMEVDLIELEADHLPLILARVRKPLHPGLFGDWEDAS